MEFQSPSAQIIDLACYRMQRAYKSAAALEEVRIPLTEANESSVMVLPAAKPLSVDQAMVQLQVALRNQRKALQTWRASLTNFRSTMNDLATSLNLLHDNLGLLGQQTRSLSATSRSVENCVPA